MNDRRILHIDMDAFFAAIEQRDYPWLRGKPIIIGEDRKRHVASTCSYEARKYGVKSSMPVVEAKRLCPQAIFVSLNSGKYVYASVKVLDILRRYSPRVEPVSIDEAYLDVTATAHLFGGEEMLGGKIKNDIYRSLRLTCSIGIAPTRLFAKMASDMQKPDGLMIIKRDEIEKRIFPLPVDKIHGVGEKSSVLLKKLGIETVGNLAKYPRDVLKQCFGVNGEMLSRMARGESDSSVVPLHEAEDEKSIGHEFTLPHDSTDLNYIRSILLWLAEKTGRRLRDRKMMGKIAVLKLRYDDFHTLTRRQTFPDFLWEEEKLYGSALMLFHENYEAGRPVRLVGVSVGGLVRKGERKYAQGVQTSLFEPFERKDRLYETIDALKDNFGERIVQRAATLDM